MMVNRHKTATPLKLLSEGRYVKAGRDLTAALFVQQRTSWQVKNASTQ